MYVSEHYICFNSNIFGWVTNVILFLCLTDILVGHCFYGSCQHRETEHSSPLSQWNSDHYSACQGYHSCDARSYVSTSSLRLSVGTGLMIFSHPYGDFLTRTAVLLTIRTSTTQSPYLRPPVHSQTTRRQYPTKIKVSEISPMSLTTVQRRKARLKTRLPVVQLVRRRAKRLLLLPPLETLVPRAMTKRNAIAAKMDITRKSFAMK